MITMNQDDQGMHRPMIYCDACGNPIPDSGKGIILWKPDESETEILHVHKGTCDLSIDRDRKSYRWDELSHHLLHVCANTKAEEHREGFDMIRDFEHVFDSTT